MYIKNKQTNWILKVAADDGTGYRTVPTNALYLNELITGIQSVSQINSESIKNLPIEDLEKLYTALTKTPISRSIWTNKHHQPVKIAEEDNTRTKYKIVLEVELQENVPFNIQSLTNTAYWRELLSNTAIKAIKVSE